LSITPWRFCIVDASSFRRLSDRLVQILDPLLALFERGSSSFTRVVM